MHVSRLTLTNVRQFDHRTFEFLPGFNLMVGINGAGKTTLLRGLLASLGSAQQSGRRPKLTDEDIRLNTRNAEVLAELKERYERELMNPKEALSLDSVSRIVMPGTSRRVLAENLDFLMRTYAPSPMGGPQREFE